MNKNDILIRKNNNKLYCEVLNLPNNYQITAYYLASNKQIISRDFTNDMSHEFTINKNAEYVVGVFYKNLESNETKSIWLEAVLFKLDLIPNSIIKSEININFDKNKIICNASSAKNLISCITRYEMTNVDGQEVIENTNELVHSFIVSKDGVYNVKVYFEDFDGQTQVLNYQISAEVKVLSSSTISINLGLNNNRSFRLLFFIIYAFVLREFQRKYDKGYFRYFSIILGPSVQIGIMVAIFTIMGTKSLLGLGVPIFVLTGMLPYNFFTSAGNCLTIVSGNRDLLNYKQIKIIDVVLSSILMELLVVIATFIGGLFVCWYLGMNIVVYNPLALILGFVLLFVLTFGLGLILSVIGFYFAEFNYAIQIIFRALFYISGVFFSVENIPVQYQKYILWNPLLQLIESIRFAFVSFQIPYELSYIYLLKCTVIVLLLGISLYFVNRNKFMINDRAR